MRKPHDNAHNSVSGAFQNRTFADKAEAEAFLSNIADSISAAHFEGTPSEFHLSYAGGALGHCDLHRGTHSKLSFKITRADEYHIVLPLKQGARFTGGHGTSDVVAGRSAILLPPRLEGHFDVQGGTTGFSLIAPATSVAARAGGLIGDDGKLGSPHQTAVMLDHADPVVKTLVRNVSNVFHEMQNLSHIGLSSLAAANFDDLLLGLASAIIWPSVRSRAGGRVTDPGPAVVQRARDFIDAHASEPIRLADLARVLGVGLRSLQTGFRRHVGCSPREYLMNCRLQLARSRLLSASSGTKVSTVAFDCGFSDLAVFSAKYRLVFGELPSETLRRR
ncbi:MAG: AraC family transcriptional regulator [Hyphomicrobiaceae bacterium]|jgi:AraC-like DNA-binding protein